MGHFAGLVVDRNGPQSDVIDPQLLTYSPLGNSSKDTQEDDEDTPQAADAKPQNAISHSSPGNFSKDTGIVINRQRKVNKGRPEKNRYLCGFFSEECEYMDNKAGFENCAKLKEDALRHINGFQCPNCGKRFGKRYGLQRHCKPTKCTKREFDEVHCELKRWMEELEGAKGYKKVKIAIDQCKKYCDINTNCQQRHPQQKEGRQCQAPQVANVPEIRSITPTDSEASVDSHMSNGITGDLLQQEEGLVDAGGHEFASAQQIGEEASASNILWQDNLTADESHRGYPQKPFCVDDKEPLTSYGDFNRGQSYTYSPGITSPQGHSNSIIYLPTGTSECAIAYNAAAPDIAHNPQNQNSAYASDTLAAQFGQLPVAATDLMPDQNLGPYWPPFANRAYYNMEDHATFGENQLQLAPRFYDGADLEILEAGGKE
ncbi:hypothetical protein EV426DRAFT_645651 [Tirmania nivea]|nr:hypothetical protein EV426DRAFT_645651 [Tirmania nivea]